MKILRTVQLSGVTGNDFSSGVSSAPIPLSRNRWDSKLGIQIQIYGDTGREVGSGSSVAVVLKGSDSKEGTYGEHRVDGSLMYLTKSGTSVTGLFANGCRFENVDVVAPFIRIHAIASKSAATKTTGVTATVMAL